MNKLEELSAALEKFVPLLKLKMKQLEHPHALADGHLYILFMLSHSASVKVSDIVRGLGITSGAATGLSDKLVALELIERKRPEDDRRVVLLQLTARGRKLVAEVRRARLAHVARLFGQLDEVRLEACVSALDELALLLEKEN